MVVTLYLPKKLIFPQLLLGVSGLPHWHGRPKLFSTGGQIFSGVKSIQILPKNHKKKIFLFPLKSSKIYHFGWLGEGVRVPSCLLL